MEQNNKPLQENVAPEKKKYYGFRAIIYNNKVTMLFSLLLAFALWLWVAIEKSPVVETTISGVPVQIDIENSVPAQLNLQMFGKTDYTVDVVVSGKRFIVSNLKPEDITVTAQTNYVDSSGNKSLQLKVTANKSKEFDIVRLSQNYIDVYFDTYKEVEFPIEPRIIAPKDQKVAEGCILGNIVFSKKSVIVSGAATDVNKIVGVVAETTLDAPLQATTTAKAEIKLQTDSGESLNHITIDTEESAVTMTMPVLKKVVLPTTVTFKNAPAGYLNAEVPVRISPSKIEAAVLIEKLEEVQSISVGTIDFSDLKSGKNNFTFSASDVTDHTVVNSNAKFKVTVDMSGTIVSDAFTVPAANMQIVGQKNGFQSSIQSTGIENVKIIGTKEEVVALTNEMLFVELDLTDEDIKEGTQTVQAHVIVKGNTKVWAMETYPVKIQSVRAE